MCYNEGLLRYNVVSLMPALLLAVWHEEIISKAVGMQSVEYTTSDFLYGGLRQTSHGDSLASLSLCSLM